MCYQIADRVGRSTGVIDTYHRLRMPSRRAVSRKQVALMSILTRAQSEARPECSIIGRASRLFRQLNFFYGLLTRLTPDSCLLSHGSTGQWSSLGSVPETSDGASSQLRHVWVRDLDANGLWYGLLPHLSETPKAMFWNHQNSHDNQHASALQ
ncbi:hypothetical protein BDW60DRAFT_93983 [Aspergillus nidulans var. acristatus]